MTRFLATQSTPWTFRPGVRPPALSGAAFPTEVPAHPVPGAKAAAGETPHAQKVKNQWRGKQLASAYTDRVAREGIRSL